MTLAKAQAVASAASTAGFNVVMTLNPLTLEWVVQVRSLTSNIPVASAASLATAQSVTGTLSSVDYI